MLRVAKKIVFTSLLSLYSSILLAGDIGVEGSVTATTFFGNGAGLTGVVTDGVEVGDMQYWDGIAWVLIPASTGEGNALIFCDGRPGWQYQIGDAGPAGGKVFYVDGTGCHGLEAAPADQSSDAEWGCRGTDLTGADGTAMGTGAQNTADILAGCGTPGIAADIADDYELNGYTDWFLPSKDELYLLYQQANVVGGFADEYWSSSEDDSNNAWLQFLPAGYQGAQDKILSIGVRAVRAF